MDRLSHTESESEGESNIYPIIQRTISVAINRRIFSDVQSRDSALIVADGLQFALEHLHMILKGPTHYVKADGNCAPRAWALALECPEVLNPKQFTKKALEIRQKAVKFARQQNQLGRIDLDYILSFYPNIHDLDSELAKLEGDGQYLQEIGDLMMQMISSHQGVPAILLNIDTNHVEYILPETIFQGQINSDIPVVLVRSHDHFEILNFNPEQGIQLAKLIKDERNREAENAANELKRKQKYNFDDDRQPSTGKNKDIERAEIDQDEIIYISSDSEIDEGDITI